MLRLGVIVTIWCTASAALAQGIVVAESASTPSAATSLVELLGPEARIEPPLPWASVDELVAWSQSTGATFAVVFAVENHRVYVVIPASHRVIERVLPDDVGAQDAYAIAIAASELVELARWGDEATLAAVTAVSIPEHSVAVEPDPEPEPQPEPQPEPIVPVVEPPGPVAVSFGVGVGARLGLDRGFALADLDLRGDLRLTRAVVRHGFLFFGAGLRGGLPRNSDSSVGIDAISTRYARTELELRAGLAMVRDAWAVRPSLRFALAWVHVAGTLTENSAGRHATDDRAAFSSGLGVDVRHDVGRRGFLGLDVGLDLLGARAPYLASGAVVIHEPVVRATLCFYGGVALSP